MLLAGYNTLPKKEREKIDRKALSKTAGNLLLRVALELFLFGVAIHLRLKPAQIIFLIAFIADLCVTIFVMWRKYPGLMAFKSRAAAAVTAAVSAVAIIVVGGVFYFGEKEPAVSVTDAGLHIGGMYGADVAFSEITDISLLEKSMNDLGVGLRVNGYGGLGDALKGHFSIDGAGRRLLFVRAESAPTILIRRAASEDIYISFSSAEKTKELYRQLDAELDA